MENKYIASFSSLNIEELKQKEKELVNTLSNMISNPDILSQLEAITFILDGKINN